MQYAIATPKHSNRPRIEYGFMGNAQIIGDPATVEWVIDETYGYHSRNVDAKRTYLIAMKELSGNNYSDTFIKRYFCMVVNLGLAKVVKVESHLTQLAPDVGYAPAQQELFTLEAEPAERKLPASTPRR